MTNKKSPALSRAISWGNENLVREDLTLPQRAMATARKKEIYEELYPETRVGRGTGGRAGRTKSDFADSAKSNNAAHRFTKDTSEATGRSERAVQVDAQRGKGLKEILRKKSEKPRGNSRPRRVLSAWSTDWAEESVRSATIHDGERAGHRKCVRRVRVGSARSKRSLRKP